MRRTARGVMLVIVSPEVAGSLAGERNNGSRERRDAVKNISSLTHLRGFLL